MDEMREEAEPQPSGLDYTIPLTEAAERDVITPNEYARRRANMVGEGTIFEYIIIPLALGLWYRLFPPQRRNGALVKPKTD